MLVDGLHVPLCVPFYRDGAVYLRKLEHNVGRLSLTPATCLVAMGFAAEAEALSDEETLLVLRTVADTAAKDKVLIARVERRSVRTALAVAEAAAAAEFDAIVLSAPAQWGSAGQVDSPAGVYFRAVADGSPLPVLLWSGDGAVHARLELEDMAELSAHPNVLGMYDVELTAERYGEIVAATENVRREVVVTPVFGAVTARMLRPHVETAGGTFVSAEQLAGGGSVALAVAPAAPAMKTRTRAVGFQVVAAGSTVGVAELLKTGVPGLMPTIAAAAPQGCHEVLAAWKDGNPELAVEKAERLLAADAAVARLGIPALKHACDLNGYYGGAPRLPLLPLGAVERLAVEDAFRAIRN